MYKFFLYTLTYEFKTANSTGNHPLGAILFFVIGNSIISFFLSNKMWFDINLIMSFPWIIFLITYILSLEKYFSNSLDSQTILFYYTFPSTQIKLLFLIKSLFHWMSYGIPISLISLPIQIIFYNIALKEAFVSFIFLNMYSCIFSFLGVLGYSICYRLKYKGSLLPIILLPFYFPFLIIGIYSISSFFSGGLLLSYIGLWFGLTLIVSICSIWFSYSAIFYSLE